MEIIDIFFLNWNLPVITYQIPIKISLCLGIIHTIFHSCISANVQIFLLQRISGCRIQLVMFRIEQKLSGFALRLSELSRIGYDTAEFIAFGKVIGILRSQRSRRGGGVRRRARLRKSWSFVKA